MYLEDNKFYVKNEDGLVYLVNYFESYDGYDTLRFTLELVCGWKDNAWQPAQNFPEDVQEKLVIQYFFEEGTKEVFENGDYTILKENPMDK